jgi:peptide methionine sulfoxide reductase MsrB
MDYEELKQELKPEKVDEQDGRRVDAGDVEIRLHAADDHVGGVDQGGGEVPLLLQCCSLKRI